MHPKRIGQTVLAALFMALALSACAPSGPEVTSAGAAEVPTGSQSAPVPREDVQEEQEEAVEEAEPELTVSQEQAIGSAESYLSFMGFSRSGLIDQLEYEGFSSADAEFAVDSLEVDWAAQAVRSAESYLEFMSFSRSGLIEQLEYEGYTREQAEFGADGVGLTS